MNTCCTHLFREAKREIEIRDKRIIELQSECAQFRDEIAKSKQGPMNNVDKEAFDKYVKENQSIYFGVPSWEINTDRTVWLAACSYKQKLIAMLKHDHNLFQKCLRELNTEIDELKIEKDYLFKKMENMRDLHKHSKKILQDENAKLRECVEFYAETGNWTRSLLESSTLREINDSDVSWTDTGGTYGEILSGGKRARQCLKELENK